MTCQPAEARMSTGEQELQADGWHPRAAGWEHPNLVGWRVRMGPVLGPRTRSWADLVEAVRGLAT